MGNKEVELHIEKYSKKGHGIATYEARGPVEVVGSVVGDHVRVELLKKQKRTFRSQLLEILSPAKSRFKPRCSHVGTCGGCTWQQLNYSAQIHEKDTLIDTLFQPTKRHPTVPCINPWAYRNKMEFTFSEDKKGTQYLGLLIARSRGRVINLNECHLTNSWFIDLLKTIRAWWQETQLKAYHPSSDTGSLRTLTLREGKRTGEKMIILTVSGRSEAALSQTHLDTFKETILKTLNGNVSIFLRIHQAIKGKPTQFYEHLLHGSEYLHETLQLEDRTLNLSISPTSFFQPNTLQAEKLYQRALQIANPSPDDLLLDLYCGTATLSMVFAPHVKKVIGVEINPYAVFDARLNLENNALSNVEVLQGDVGEILPTLQESPQIICIDPPRSGLSQKSLVYLLHLKPNKILYISCNPRTQHENIEKLLEGGYQLREIQPVDQFPHTPHIENIALLTR